MAGDVAREALRARARAMPWTVRLQLRALEAGVDATQRRDGTINRFLFSLLVDRQAPANPARPDALGVRSVDVTVDASTGVRARAYFSATETEPSPRPVIVYFHGGGFTYFSAATRPYDALCRTICRETGAVVVSVSYRLAPEHRFPAAYDDGEAALRYLATTGLPAEIPVRADLTRCFLAGDSAGANIAHHVAQRWTAAATTPPIRLAGILLLAAYFGGEDRTESELALEGVAPIVNLRRSDFWWKAFLPEGADRNHPAAHVTGEAGPELELPEAFPPAMVVVGGLDPLQDYGRQYAAMLRRKGKEVRVVEFPDAVHAFYFFPVLPDTGKLVAEIKAFVGSIGPEPIA
ncbi:probable carboxylesterase 18 [Lolium perenne]|uniref:probable carboxylesterase 18 n=1 Tax=Lolium perenne TaxID=4522 RepID=UPI0021F512EC|nr:probable carboxylesterase 18 [Lolium perenne]